LFKGDNPFEGDKYVTVGIGGVLENAWLQPLKNALLQHFEILIGRLIEIVWVWAPTKNFALF
jgi:hypothetical protein